jgi:PAS domain S-box-containing protein
MWVYDLETLAFLAVNTAAVEKYGYTEEEFLSMTIKDIRPPEDVPLLLENLRQVRSESERSGTWRHRTKGGDVIDVDIVSHELNFDERPARLVLAHDVTERRRAEKEAREASQRYRTTLDHMLEGCQIIGRDYRYLYVNDVAARHGRTTKQELVGSRMTEKYPGIETTDMFGHLKRCMEDRVPYTMENEFTYPDGSKGWFQLSMEPVPEGVFILSSDITKEKKQEEELRKYREQLEELVRQRTEQLEEVNRELEAFSYSVSHDLRAPLRHIGGFVELLRKNKQITLDETAGRYMDVISGAAVQMGQLIDDLLVFSRMSRTDLLHSTVDLGNLTREVIRDLAGEQKDRNVEWTLGDLPVVEGDPAMLRVVLSNLLSNALKYTRPRETARIEIGSRKDDTETVFWVKDNGVGFDMKYLDKLFGVFQRLHSVEEFEGTGIGLATVRRIIGRHGGRTWAEGKVNAGAAFFFALPKREAHRTR